MSLSTLTPFPVDSEEFVCRLNAAMLPLQLSLRSLHNELGRPKNTVAMQRQLGVGNTICWQVSRIVNADSLVSAARHAPLPQATMQLLEAAQRVGVSSKVLLEVREASEGFRGFMRVHADDRASFDTLVAGVASDDGQDQIQTPHRRAAFRAESHIWGIQRDLSAMTAFVRRSATGTGFDVAMLLSQYGYRRLRANALAAVFAFGDAANEGSTMRPLDPSAMLLYHSPLVPEFCSNPVPPLERVAVPNGQVVYRLADNSLGRGGSKDLTTGVFVSGDKPVTIRGQPSFEIGHTFHCPTGRMVLSLFLDKETFGDRVPSMRTRLVGFNENDPRGQPLPMNERMLPLGTADRVPDCKDVPKYLEMVRYLANRSGWNPTQFNSFRTALDFPVFSSSLTLQVPVDWA